MENAAKKVHGQCRVMWRGRECTKRVVEFGERITHAQALSVGKHKVDARWKEGVWLGIKAESGEPLIGTSDGVVRRETSEGSQTAEAGGAMKTSTSSEACCASRIQEQEEDMRRGHKYDFQPIKRSSRKHSRAKAKLRGEKETWRRSGTRRIVQDAEL